jgi:polyketide synthase 5
MSRKPSHLIARESGFSVTTAMSVPQMVTGQDRVQPTLFAMQVALAASMKAYGVRPGAREFLHHNAALSFQ